MKRVGKNEKGALKGETELDCEKEKNQKKSAQKKNKSSFLLASEQKLYL